MELETAVLRELFRSIQEFRSFYVATGISTIDTPYGEVCLFDVEHLLEQRVRLAPRQKQAIELCLIEGMRESDAARVMGLKPTNPVAMYATDGINHIIQMVYRGEVPRYRGVAA